VDCFVMVEDRADGGQWVKEPSGAIKGGELIE